MRISSTIVLCVFALLVGCVQEEVAPIGPALTDVTPALDGQGVVDGSARSQPDLVTTPDVPIISDDVTVPSDASDVQEVSEEPDVVPTEDIVDEVIDVSDDAGPVNCDPEDDPCMACVCKADGTKVCVPREQGTACKVDNCCVEDSVCSPCPAGTL